MGVPESNRLWTLQHDGRCRLLASRYVREEADRNLRRPAHRDRLQARLSHVDLVPEAPAELCPIDVAAKDRPVVSAALAARATHLITGDTHHFSLHYGSRVARMVIVRPADYLRSLELD